MPLALLATAWPRLPSPVSQFDGLGEVAAVKGAPGVGQGGRGSVGIGVVGLEAQHPLAVGEGLLVAEVQSVPAGRQLVAGIVESVRVVWKFRPVFGLHD
jgi:hypothetical protein